jgi:hypothetical protein
MVEERPRWTWLRDGLWPTVTAILIVRVVWCVLYLLKWSSQHNNDSSKTTIAADASTLIGMFITLYALFLGGFAALAPFVTKGDTPRFWKILAVELLIGASLLDLWRILDSTANDLYTSGIVGLTNYQVRDNVDDFTHYFSVNVAVIAFAIVVSCLSSPGLSTPRERGGAGTPRQQGST